MLQKGNEQEGLVAQPGDEQAIIKRAQKGDAYAFEQILFRYEKKIFNYSYRLLGTRHDAEDATQETFVKAYKKITSFHSDQQFSPWIYKIATNTAYDILRKKQTRRENSLDDPKVDAAETIAELSPYKIMERTADLELALHQLKPIHKTVLSLYYWDDLPYQNIAEILNIPVNTVKTHIKRAKEQLGKIMSRKR